MHRVDRVPALVVGEDDEEVRAAPAHPRLGRDDGRGRCGEGGGADAGRRREEHAVRDRIGGVADAARPRRRGRVAHARIGQRWGDRVLTPAPAVVLAEGEVVGDPLAVVVRDAPHLPPHELVAFAEELLDAARAAVAHQREQRAELALDREAAFGARDRRQRVGQVTGIGSRMQAPEEGRTPRPDPPTDRRVCAAVVIDVLAVVQLRDRDPRDGQREGDEPGRRESAMGVHGISPPAVR